MTKHVICWVTGNEDGYDYECEIVRFMHFPDMKFIFFDEDEVSYEDVHIQVIARDYDAIPAQVKPDGEKILSVICDFLYPEMERE